MLFPFHIAMLELKRYLVNRGGLAFSIALPICLFGLMYGAFGTDTSFHATADVVDLDGGVHSRDLIERLDSMDEVRVRERTAEDADDALDRSAIYSVAVIPAGFSTALDSGDPTAITFRQRGNGGDDGQIVAAIVGGAAQDVAGEAGLRRIAAEMLAHMDVPQSQFDAEIERAIAESRRTPPVGVVERTLSGESPDALDRLLPGLLVMSLMFALTLGSQTLVEERQDRTLERLLTTRLGVNQLFLGKFLAGALRVTAQALILLSLAFAVLRIGGAVDFVQVMAFSALVAAAVSAMGLVIGSVARTRDQAAWAAVFVTMFMTIFGGTFFDVAGNGALELLSRFTLTSYAIDAMHGMLAGGETLTQQGLGAGVLAGATVVCLVGARLMFRAAGGGR